MSPMIEDVDVVGIVARCSMPRFRAIRRAARLLFDDDTHIWHASFHYI